jgi:hypothetical protein
VTCYGKIRLAINGACGDGNVIPSITLPEQHGTTGLAEPASGRIAGVVPGETGVFVKMHVRDSAIGEGTKVSGLFAALGAVARDDGAEWTCDVKGHITTKATASFMFVSHGKAFLKAAICSGPMPQQPPKIVAPCICQDVDAATSSMGEISVKTQSGDLKYPLSG